MKETVKIEDWGRIAYKEAWDRQEALHNELIRKKRAGEKPRHHHFILCTHNPVYTLGKSGSKENLLLKEEELGRGGFEYYPINRGGDITYHGPGQLVGYPILDMEYFFRDVHKYVRNIEEVIIRTCEDFDVEASREEGLTGVWVNNKRKIAAIGVHFSRWVTMHGFAFNIHPDLSHFNNIIPCGITDNNKTVTSLSAELRRNIKLETVKSKISQHFEDVFKCKLIYEV